MYSWLAERFLRQTRCVNRGNDQQEASMSRLRAQGAWSRLFDASGVSGAHRRIVHHQSTADRVEEAQVVQDTAELSPDDLKNSGQGELHMQTCAGLMRSRVQLIQIAPLLRRRKLRSSRRFAMA